MKYLYVLLLVMCVYLPVSTAHATPRQFFVPDSFKLFHTQNGARYLADFDGMVTDGNTNNLWVRVIEPEAPANKQRVEYATEYLYQFNCPTDTALLKRSIIYRSNGEILYESDAKSASSIIPGSFLEAMVNAVCIKQQSPQEPAVKFCTSKSIPQHILDSYSDRRLYQVPVVLKNARGDIGGFVVRQTIMDTPINYFDCNGKFLASFHIFAPAPDRDAAAKIIEELTKAFPLQESLESKAP